MEQTKITNKEDARQKAIDWQKWQSERNLSYYEFQYWQSYFQLLGSRFGLTDEFKENGII